MSCSKFARRAKNCEGSRAWKLLSLVENLDEGAERGWGHWAATGGTALHRRSRAAPREPEEAEYFHGCDMWRVWWCIALCTWCLRCTLGGCSLPELRIFRRFLSQHYATPRLAPTPCGVARAIVVTHYRHVLTSTLPTPPTPPTLIKPLSHCVGTIAFRLTKCSCFGRKKTHS